MALAENEPIINLIGGFDINNQQPIASSIYDPDGLDTTMPMVMSPLGLED
ncbi:hypothetical protein [Halobacteroides halobius]|nr:hypothetical protein [Halobacteroides halobius]